MTKQGDEELKRAVFAKYREPMDKKAKEFEPRFRKVFGVSIHDFQQPDLGLFDFIKFDHEVLKTPNGKTPEEQVKVMFGEEGAKLMAEVMEEM
jgi:hypothetical protein